MARKYTPEELGLPSAEEYSRSLFSEEQPKAKTSGLGAAVESRASNLGADILEGLDRTYNYIDNNLGKSDVPGARALATLSKSPISQLPLAKWAEGLRKHSDKIGYEPSKKISDVFDNPANVIPFAIERIVGSTPDMAGYMLPPAMLPYLMGRSNELLNETLKNDGREFEDATFGDVARAVGLAGAVMATDKVLLGRLTQPGGVVPGTTATQRIGMEAGVQGTGEAAQNLLEYVGTHAGTKTGVDPGKGQEAIIEGYLVGKPFGAAGRGVYEAGRGIKEAVQGKQSQSVPEEPTADTAPETPPGPEQVAPVQPEPASEVTPEPTQPVDETQIDSLVEDFGYTPDEARLIIENEQRRAAAEQAEIQETRQPEPVQTELQQVLARPEVKNAINEAEATVNQLGDFGSPTTNADIKRQVVESALVDNGANIAEARRLTQLLEENNYADIGDGTIAGTAQSSVPLSGARPAGAPGIDGNQSFDLGRNIQPVGLPQGRVQEQYNPLIQQDQGLQQYAPTQPTLSQPQTFDIPSQTPTAIGQASADLLEPKIRRPEEKSPKLDLSRFVEPLPEQPVTPEPSAEVASNIDLGRIESEQVPDINRSVPTEQPLIDLGRLVEEQKRPKQKVQPEQQVKRKPRKSIEDLRKDRAEKKRLKEDYNKRNSEINDARRLLAKSSEPELSVPTEDRTNAIQTLDNIVRSQKYKGTPVARNARRILRSIPQKEVENVRKSSTKSSKSTETAQKRAVAKDNVSRNPNPKYQSFKTAKQAINWVKNNGTKFERDLASKLSDQLNGVELKVTDDMKKHLNRSAKESGESDAVTGLFSQTPSRQIIYLDADRGNNNVVFLHEALHAATQNKINTYDKIKSEGGRMPYRLGKAMDQLNSVMADAKKKFDELSPEERADYGLNAKSGKFIFENTHEFVSYGLTSPSMQAFLMNADSSASGFRKLFNAFVNALRNMFGIPPSDLSAFHDLVDATNSLFGVNLDGVVPEPAMSMMHKIDSDIQRDIRKMKDARTANGITSNIFDLAKTGHSFASFKEALDARFDSISEKSLRPLLMFMQSDDIVRWKGDALSDKNSPAGYKPPLARLNDVTRKISGMRTRLHGKANELASTLSKFIRKNSNQKISDVMHIARLQEIEFSKNRTLKDALVKDWLVKQLNDVVNDPSATASDKADAQKELAVRKKNLTEAYKIWDDLGRQDGGHKMYDDMHKYYQSYMRSRRYYLDKRLEGMDMGDAAKKNLVNMIRVMYERASKESGDYFPLMRHGDYWVRVKKIAGQDRGFYKFDTIGERNKFLDEYAKKHGLDKNDSSIFSVGTNESGVYSAIRENSKMLKEMFKAIDNGAGKDADALKDEVFQIYLQTMPESSMRRQFIHPDKVAGFNADVLRNFKVYATKAGNELARLAYTDQVDNEVAAARDILEGVPTLEKAKLNIFVDEMEKRAQSELNPPAENNIINKLNQFTFLWLLTSASTAMVQMASVPIMVVPTLAARYGMASAGAKFAKYSNFLKSLSGKVETHSDGSKTIVWPTIKESQIAKDNKLLAKAIQETTDDYNLFQSTNVSVLTDRRKTPDKVADNAYQSMAGKTYNIMTAMFNGSERVSRELAFGMTFELEYAKTKDYDKAKQAAMNAVDELLGRYDNANRPRVFQNALMKNIGQFKQYSVVMTSFWIRNMYNALKGEDMNTRMYAINRMTGAMLMGALFHGLFGSPFYGMTALTIDAILNNIDDEDLRERIKRNPLTATSSDLRFRYEWLPETFGEVKVPDINGREQPLSRVLERGPISVLSDMNFGSKTSHDVMGLWFREGRPGRHWAETAQNMLIANLGPTVSVGFNAVGGLEDISEGRVARGLEKLAPAFVRGIPTVHRLSTEGAENRGGHDILRKSEISDLNLVGAMLGLQTTRLAQLQDRNFRFMSQIIEIGSERSGLLKKLNTAIYDENKPDLRAVEDVYRDIVKFNNRYPVEGFYIDFDAIDRSTASYAERKAKSYRGLQINDKTLPYMAKILKLSEPAAKP